MATIIAEGDLYVLMSFGMLASWLAIACFFTPLMRPRRVAVACTIGAGCQSLYFGWIGYYILTKPELRHRDFSLEVLGTLGLALAGLTYVLWVGVVRRAR